MFGLWECRESLERKQKSLSMSFPVRDSDENGDLQCDEKHRGTHCEQTEVRGWENPNTRKISHSEWVEEEQNGFAKQSFPAKDHSDWECIHGNYQRYDVVLHDMFWFGHITQSSETMQYPHLQTLECFESEE